MLGGFIEERAVTIASYTIENNATVWQTAKQFGISKSMVDIVATSRTVLLVGKIGYVKVNRKPVNPFTVSTL